MRNSFLLLGVLFIGIPHIALAGPALELSPSSLSFGSTTTELWFNIKNTGDQYLEWSIESDLPGWLTLSQMTGDPITPDEWASIKATVTRTSMGPANYNHDISVTTNGGDGTVTVTMTVPGLTIGSTSGGSVTTPGEGNFNRDYGEVVSLVASAQSGYVFTGWDGDTGTMADPDSSSTTITINGYHAITGTFQGLPVLTLQPQNLDFGTVTTELYVNIGNSGNGPLSWQLEQDLPSWLSFPSSGAAGVGETLPYMAAVDRAGLNPGTYQHTMLIISNGGKGQVEVNMEVPDSEPQSYFLTISSGEGGYVADPGEGTFEYPLDFEVPLEAVADPGWNFAGWSGGTGTMANPDSASTTITILGNQSINASFSQGPVLQVSPASLDLGLEDQSAFFNVSNAGSGSLVWETEGEIAEWLELSKTDGELGSGTHELVTASVDRSGLSPGTYACIIHLVSNGGESEVGVAMDVPEGDPQIVLEPQVLNLGTSLTKGSVYIQNPGSAALDWDMVSDLPSWLSANPMTGYVPAGHETEINITVSRSALSPGQYGHTIQFESNAGPATCHINMVVPEPLMVQSPFSYLPPVIDGQIDAGEWNRSAFLDLGAGYLGVQNDASCMYMLLDIPADTEGDPSDLAWITFDIDGDGEISPNLDTNYRASVFQGMQLQYYLGEESWTPLQACHSTAGAGFGPSIHSRYNHRVWELAFSLPELESKPGQKVRVGVRLGSDNPPLSKSIPPNFTGDFSTLTEINLSTRDIELLMLTDQDFVEELIPLKKHKDHTDMESYIQSWQTLNRSFASSGVDIQERIKMGAAAYEDACGIKYLMLVGDCDRFPVRYCKIHDPTHWGNNFAPSDLYYADLYEQDGSFEDWDGDGDLLFGEMDGIPWQSGDPISTINLDDADLIPDIAVGRIPASTASEVKTYVEKIISYEFSSYDSSWFQRALMVVPGYKEGENAYNDYADAWKTMEHVSSNLSSAGMTPVRLYDQRIADLPAGLSDGNPDRESINDELNKGAGFVSFGGHGNTDLWAHVYTSDGMKLHFRSAEKWHEYFCLGQELPVIGDFSGDGRDDIACFLRDSGKGSAQGDVYVAISTGSNFGPGQIWHGNLCPGGEIPRVGDFNGDGKDDIACFHRNVSEVHVALSTGSSFGTQQKWQNYFCLPGEWPEVGDFNGDGKDDIITFIKGTKSGSAANDVYVSLSNGTSFLPGKLWHGSFSWGSEIPMIGDFDGDGKDDIITFKRSAANVHVALSTGTKFGSPDLWHGNFCYPSQEPGVGDFNGDGSDDIIAFTRKEAGKVWVSLSSGSKFQPARTWTTNFCAGNETPLTGNFRWGNTSGIVNFVGDERNGTQRGDVYVSFPVKLDNADRLPVVFAAACSTAHFHYQGKHLDVNGKEFDPSVECPPCCGWNDSRCWPKNPNAVDPPVPAAIQRNATRNYDSDSLAEFFLVKRDVGAIGYIGCYTGSQPAGLTLDRHFFEAYTYSSKPAIMGDIWNRALYEYIQEDFGINPLWTSTWRSQAYYHHAQKFQLFGDPSLRIGGISPTQRKDAIGNWSMVHDGWLGNLDLWEANGDAIEGTPNIKGNYTASDGKTHDVQGRMNTWKYRLSPSWGPDHKFQFQFKLDFQDTPSAGDDQVFEAYLFTQTLDGMAGKTWWHGTPYGFYALKNQEISYETGAPGTIVLSDFLGTYDFTVNGVQGTLELWPSTASYSTGPNVEGRYTTPDGESFNAWGYVRTPSHPMPQSWGPDHKIELYIDFSGGILVGILEKYEGYLFTQTKAAMAGVRVSPGETYGFCATKEARHVVQIETCPNGTVSSPGTGNLTFDSGENVSLSASPSQDHEFSLWTGDVDTVENVESPDTTFTVYGNYSLKATFVPIGDSNTPPRFTSGPSVKCETNWAIVEWVTDESANGTVRYDTVSRIYGYSESHRGNNKIHSINLTGLEPSTTYHFLAISMDVDGNTASEAGLFSTLPIPDNEEPLIELLPLEGTLNGTKTVLAEATDNVGVEKVEFYVDGVQTFTDYSPPYRWPFDTPRFLDGNYTITAKAYDGYGKAAEDSAKVRAKNTPDPTAPYVSICSWTRSEEYLTVWADISDQNGLSTAQVYVDGNLIQTEGFPSNPKTANIEFKWYIKPVPKGKEYRIGIMAYDVDLKMGLDTLDILLPATPKMEPKLVVTSRELTRNQNVFTMKITVKNVGKGNATGIILQDYLRLLQPISSNSSTADILAEYNPSAKWWYCLILVEDDIDVGKSRTFTYKAVPVMLQSNQPTPEIGKLKLWYESLKGSEHSSTWSSVKYTTGGQTLQAAYDKALEASNYLIVTNPFRAIYYYNKQDAQNLLSTMARLAMLKHGTLGYLDTNSASAFDKVIGSQGAWNKKLSPSFSKLGHGYLLIVGETELVPSWHQYGFDIEWNNAPNTKDVPLSDHPYSDTTGNGVPDLIVGRVIGNTLEELTATINHSIYVHLGQGGSSYDRSHALLVSGTGYKQGTFVNDVTNLVKVLKGKGLTASELHLKWYSTHDQKASAFKQSILDQDLICFRGHGNLDEWDDIQCGLKTSSSSWSNPNDFPLDFGQASPAVIALSCLTGNYESGDDYNIAEGFLNSGAVVYIGSTQLAPMKQDSKAGNHIFNNWDTTESIGKAFLETERNRYGTDKYGNLFAWEYNIYGDPKFGAVPSLSSNSREGGETLSPELVVTVPQYTVTELEGFDHVDIPGGWTYMERDRPQIPYYVQSFSCPVRTKVQSVELTEKTGLTRQSGLHLPLTTNDFRGGIGSDSTLAEGGWYPGSDYRWTEIEKPDGASELVLQVFPFQYDPSTGESMVWSTFTFEVDYTQSDVSIITLDTDRAQYDIGESVDVEISIQNSGYALDLVTDICIRRIENGDLVEGLLLQTLSNLKGPASCGLTWHPQVEPGHYYVEAEIKNLEGQVFDRRTADLQVGLPSCELTEHEVETGNGNISGMSITVQNTGRTELSGSGVFIARDKSGNTVWREAKGFETLSPGGLIELGETCSFLLSDISSIVMYVSHDGVSTEPVVWTPVPEPAAVLLLLLGSGWALQRTIIRVGRTNEKA